MELQLTQLLPSTQGAAVERADLPRIPCASADVVQWGRVRFYCDARQHLIARLADGTVGLVVQTEQSDDAQPMLRAVTALLVHAPARRDMYESVRWGDEFSAADAVESTRIATSLGDGVLADFGRDGRGPLKVAIVGRNFTYYEDRGRYSEAPSVKGAPALDAEEAARAIKCEKRRRFAVASRR